MKPNLDPLKKLKKTESEVMQTLSRAVSDYILLTIATNHTDTVNLELASIADLSSSGTRIEHDTLEAALEVRKMIQKQLEVLERCGHLEDVEPGKKSKILVTRCPNHNVLWEIKPTQNLRAVLTQYKIEQKTQ